MLEKTVLQEYGLWAVLKTALPSAMADYPQL